MKVFKQSVFEKWPIENNSIQSVVTSPPYWQLRRYDIPDIKIGEWIGQYGLEEYYQDYIDHTLLWCEEVYRVLREDGIFFLNIGDSYSTISGGGKQGEWGKAATSKGLNGTIINKIKQNIPSKCKMLIPQRIAIGLIDQGWILRNNIIWFKPNAMPESVVDRFSKKYEDIFMLVKTPKYYFDIDSVRIPHKQSSIDRYKHEWNGEENRDFVKGKQNNFSKWNKEKKEAAVERGKNPGDIWEVSTQPSSEKHFAMWPENLVERMINCSTKVNDIVMDPFVGSGSTLRKAEELNRKSLGIDLGYESVQKKKLSNIQKRLF